MNARDRDAEVRAVTSEINKLLDELTETVAALNLVLAPAKGPDR